MTTSRTTWGRLTAVVLAALVVSACTGSKDHTTTSGRPDAESTPTAPTAPTSSSTPTPPTASPAASASAAAGDVIALGKRFAPQVSFASPSHNLACDLVAEGYVICRALKHTWTSHASDQGNDCGELKRLAGVQLDNQGVQERVDCYEPSDQPSTVLEYGHGLELGGIRCASEARGISCLRVGAHVGFSISSSSLQLKPWDDALMTAPARRLGNDSAAVYPAGVHVNFVVGDYQGDCLLSDRLATCLVNTGGPRPSPASTCEFDQALTAELSGDRPGRLFYDCRSDANGGQDRLRPGASIQVGDLRCTASKQGFRCAHLGGRRHGFVVTASGFRGY